MCLTLSVDMCRMHYNNFRLIKISTVHYDTGHGIRQMGVPGLSTISFVLLACVIIKVVGMVCNGCSHLTVHCGSLGFWLPDLQ